MGVTVELMTFVNALTAQKEAGNALPAEDDEDDEAEEADSVPQHTDDMDDGAEKVYAIPQPIDAEDDMEAILQAAVTVGAQELILVLRESRASSWMFILS